MTAIYLIWTLPCEICPLLVPAGGLNGGVEEGAGLGLEMRVLPVLSLYDVLYPVNLLQSALVDTEIFDLGPAGLIPVDIFKG